MTATELVTEVSDFHRDLMRWLEENGVCLMEEVSFPPFHADIYVPAAHAIIEADGYGHTERKDRRRDGILEETYSLKVLHVTPAQFSNKTKLAPVVNEFLGTAADDAPIRWDKCKMRTPWL